MLRLSQILEFKQQLQHTRISQPYLHTFSIFQHLNKVNEESLIFGATSPNFPIFLRTNIVECIKWFNFETSFTLITILISQKWKSKNG